MCKSVAVITARGGSKRIPRKNIREFCGKPILAYSIEGALESKLFDEVMVSTEDKEIAAIAKAYGAKVPFMRSIEKADDHTTTAEVLVEVLDSYAKMGIYFEKMCCIYPTAPFITIDKLNKGMQLLENYDGAIPVVKFSFPPQRGVVVENEKIQVKWPEYANTRSQDLEVFYHDCGQFYCANIKSFLREKTLFMKNTAPIIVPEMEVQDIDCMEDWEIAELKYIKMLQNEIFLRKADKRDVFLFYKWANEEECRQNSFHSEKITYEVHAKWFEKRIEDKHTQMYVLCYKNPGIIDIGQVRIEVQNCVAAISYSIDKNYRKKGYGRQILQLMEAEVKKMKAVDCIVGKVKKENIPSQIIFEKLDYVKSEEDGYLKYSKNLG
ncbi:MAG: pseudaminic acid cytidylyltransferase, partial [Acetivibrio sp.]